MSYEPHEQSHRRSRREAIRCQLSNVVQDAGNAAEAGACAYHVVVALELLADAVLVLGETLEDKADE